MRATISAVLSLVASVAWAQATDNPYALKLDVATSTYRLAIPSPGTADAAAAGATSAAPQPRPPSTTAQAQRADEIAELRLREREYAYRISELVRERDAWRLHAQRLESELQLGRTGVPAPLRLPPPPAR